MSAEVKLLRDAAALMRDRAQKATPGPWGVGNGHIVGAEMEQIGPGHIRYRHWIADLDDFSREESDYPNPAAPEDDAKHIASWHPAVALAVADWLDSEADYFAPPWMSSREGLGRALTVARAYLRSGL